MKNKIQNAIFILLATSQLYTPAYAGGLLNTVGDVASLGATRRERKKKDKEKDAAVARERSIAMQQKKSQEILSKKSEIEIYKKNYTELLMMRLDLETIIQISNQIVVGLELAMARDVTLTDRLRILFFVSNSNVQITNDFLNKILSSRDEALVANMAEIESSLISLSALARSNKMTVAELFEQVMYTRNNDELKSFAENIIQMRGALTSLASKCEINLRADIINHNALSQALLRLDSKANVTLLAELNPRSWLAYFDVNLNKYLAPETLQSLEIQCNYINCKN